ncbi:MAG: YeeE/YedE family protein [Clostridium sp.]|nr:YeeE/YedE family protein [Clostridium sp.]
MKAQTNVKNVTQSQTHDLQPAASLLLLALVIGSGYILSYSGQRILGFSLLMGLGLGYAFQRSRFCLGAAFRDFILFRSIEPLKSIVLLLTLSSLGFIVIFFYSALNNNSLPLDTDPFGIHTAVGATLFGIGMVLAASCASGMLMRLGEGYIQQYGTLVGFLIGSILGAWNQSFWLPIVFQSPTIFLPAQLGWPLALVVHLGPLILLYLYLRRLTRQADSHGNIIAGFVPIRKIYREAWSYKTGAIAIAVLSTLLYYGRGRYFAVTTGITYWGTWVFSQLGGNVADWAYYQLPRHQHALDAGFFLTNESLLNFGFILGALISSLGASEARIRKVRSFKHSIVSVVGGVLMGYGSRLALGCNIGAFLSSIASFSVSGWVFALFSFLGAWLGIKLFLRIYNLQ